MGQRSQHDCEMWNEAILTIAPAGVMYIHMYPELWLWIHMYIIHVILDSVGFSAVMCTSYTAVEIACNEPLPEVQLRVFLDVSS